MTEDPNKVSTMNIDRAMEETIHQIILACGQISLKEKVRMLYRTIDYIFIHNPELIPVFCDQETIH